MSDLRIVNNSTGTWWFEIYPPDGNMEYCGDDSLAQFVVEDVDHIEAWKQVNAEAAQLAEDAGLKEVVICLFTFKSNLPF